MTDDEVKLLLRARLKRKQQQANAITNQQHFRFDIQSEFLWETFSKWLDPAMHELLFPQSGLFSPKSVFHIIILLNRS